MIKIEKPAKTQRTVIQQRTRKAIMDKSARLFRDKGYGSTSLRDIASATGMKAGSLYYHFSSKEELAEEVLTQGLFHVAERVKEAVEALPSEASPLEKIRAAMVGHLTALLEKGDYTSANIRCYNHVPAPIKKRLKADRESYDAFWEDLIQSSVTGSFIRKDVDQVSLRYALIGMLNWTLEWPATKHGSPEELGAKFFDMVFSDTLA
ncbi:MAG: TetR/AcrR family transcriptional regulator [Sneathiella sp.]|nr:TetR/AcrR family transcriptional regulator [Sneathiella sp.]